MRCLLSAQTTPAASKYAGDDLGFAIERRYGPQLVA
jgi:hypothetical protein